MIQNTQASRWDELLTEALKLIDHVNREDDLLPSSAWTFGGGTAMMLQIDHRESHDVDLFLDDPQLLGFLAGAVEQLDFDLGKPTYDGDGTRHLKIAFETIGEIDFIVAAHVTDAYSRPKELLGRNVNLETIPEIIAKKIQYRTRLQPRDIFDIAAASEAGYEKEIRTTLSEISQSRDAAAESLDKVNEDFVASVISQLILKPGFEATARNALAVTRRLLGS